ncbi:probable BOI-related E3 ubiquitin-protein ligase 3 [Neltuma alba]|uniref:probable BOI-related E3 ubiquitin-protein ligase 3 n=1 Tax=Neltuma alba TaxID=207710 RepID=UPI0010A34FBD|nr:probable BOI-related E3 ubiquitin-protein ligase 3 [Prosopis alba]
MAIQAQLCPGNIGFPLCGSQDLITENNGLAQSCFNSQQKHQQQQDLRQLYSERQRNQNMFVDTNLLFSSNNTKANNLNPASPSISQSMALQFEKQSQDMDRYIRLQNEKLRIMLQHQRKQQVASLLKKFESDAVYMLRQKDEEIAQATKKRMELEEFLRRLEEENQAWRKLAQEKEAMVLSLHNTLEQAKEKASHGLNNGVAADDAGSCCNDEGEKRRGIIIGGEEDDGVEVEQSTRKMMICESCNSGKACFLFLPCRHLCSCRVCEALLQACPVCSTPKKASIETLIF